MTRQQRVAPTLPAQGRNLHEPLLAWSVACRRDLPWRRTRDPYAIWVSEVMLQQTQVSTVLPYFARFMQRFPDVATLARASEDDVLHAWQGLGYYSRARSLRRAARMVLDEHDGKVPGTFATLRTLSGVGPYTAGAIASIAFGERVPVVDGNVVRVLCRLFALRGDPARMPLKHQLSETAAGLVPTTRAGDYNQALMELGATVCSPRRPDCTACPLAARCEARRRGLVERLPELAKRAATTEVQMAAALVFFRQKVLVIQLASDAPRWAGMWQFPTVELAPDESTSAAALRAARTLAGVSASEERSLGSLRHSVTRYRITLSGELCSAQRGAVSLGDGVAAAVWKRPAALGELAMPAAHAKLARKCEAELARPKD